ncbi:MAG: hypothetical protein ACPF87_06610, partial [Flavobacteriales bacterium]
MNISFSRPSLLASLSFLLILCTGVTLDAQGQRNRNDDEEPILIPDKDLDELLEWCVDGKYEKVLYKAIRYTEDDEQKKHPMPYFYMSMAYLGIHNYEPAIITEGPKKGQVDEGDAAYAEKLAETFEVDKNKALKNSLKYASKFVKKDREREYIHDDYAQDFFEELRKKTKKEAETEIVNGKYTKAKGYYKYLTALDAEDPGA